MYQEEYKRKLTTAAEAVKPIKNKAIIVYGMSVTEPPALLQAIADKVRSEDISIEVFSFLPFEHSRRTIRSPDLCHRIQAYSWFVGKSDRKLIRAGLNYHIPSYLHQAPKLCQEYMDIDVAITTVSPMDKGGYFSFGTGNDYISTATRCAKYVILEVNRNMPRVFGQSLIHLSEVNAVVENHVPLMELPIIEPKTEDDLIGKAVAELIPNGATLQLGIGNLPNAVSRALSHHQDLGIHTELLTSGMIHLIKKGVITGRKKNLHPYKHIFTTASGSKEMYEFMNDNASMESYPASYVCKPSIIAKNDHMIAVNSIIEVDLLGQCNAEYLDEATYSGTGGQLDFVRGAFDSNQGKSIHVFYSTAKNGTISRIVPRLSEGAVVTCPRAETHYLATEYGIANIKGLSTRDRALSIIELAHPKFRDELLKAAENMYLI